MSNGIMPPLGLSGWREFVRVKWGYDSQIVTCPPDASPKVAMLIYLDSSGNVRMPLINPHLPVVFTHTPTNQLYRIENQWLTVCANLAKLLGERPIKDRLVLDPVISDVRSFQWSGYSAEVRYTYYIDFPFSTVDSHSSVRKQIAKSQRNGFDVRRTSDYGDVIACMRETEQRQQFRYRIDAIDLGRATALLGDSIRSYVCYSQDGTPASSRVVLHQPGFRAIDLLAGTNSGYLNSGVTQHLISYILDDLARSGATGFDFAGANLANVAASKSVWGGYLKPYYCIERQGVSSMIRLGRAIVRDKPATKAIRAFAARRRGR